MPARQTKSLRRDGCFEAILARTLHAAQGKTRLEFALVQPIWRTAVVKVKAIFVLSSDRRGVGVRRAVFDGFPGEANVDA